VNSKCFFFQNIDLDLVHEFQIVVFCFNREMCENKRKNNRSEAIVGNNKTKRNGKEREREKEKKTKLKEKSKLLHKGSELVKAFDFHEQKTGYILE